MEHTQELIEVGGLEGSRRLNEKGSRKNEKIFFALWTVLQIGIVALLVSILMYFNYIHGP